MQECVRYKAWLIHVHAAHAALAKIRSAHTAAASGCRLRSALWFTGAGRECRVLGREVIMTTGGALDSLGFRAAAHKLFEFGSAIVASVFENRHASKLAGTRYSPSL